jgi:ParB-like chromosome segregation protein Spo0J
MKMFPSAKSMLIIAANIREMGLLQPIGIDRYYQLIFGARRLYACGEILKWTHIPCVVLELESALAGEFAENEFRKQFTASERAAIGRAIEEELGSRKGQRTDLAANAAKLPEGKTADLAAKRAGFKSAETFERAKTVTDRGTSELVQAMDTGKISISAAAAIASQPKAEQQRIVQMPKDQQREIVRNIKKTKADREADERHARDLRQFRGLNDAVRFIADFSEDPRETWAGLSRVYVVDFTPRLDRAIECLMRIRRAHPNEPRKPEIVAKSS